MNDGRQDSAFFIFPHLPLFREKFREDGGESGCSSILPQRERDGVVRKWRCRRLGLAKGSPSRNTHTHTHRGRITLIYLARQQLASVCSVLTPVQPSCYWSFSSPSFCCLSVRACVRACVQDTSQVEECIQHFHLIFHEGNLDSSTYTHVTTICGSEVCKIHTEERSARVQLEKETQRRRITCRVDPSSRTDRNRTLECIAFPAVL